jgi:ABC-type branched-subunit amino acid transport system substrate-binding protein
LSGDIVTIATCVADERLSDPSNTTRLFRVFLATEGMAAKAAEHIQSRGAQKTALVYINDDYGRATAQSFKTFFLAKADHSVIEETFTLLEKDFRTQWAKLLLEEPSAVFLIGYGPGYFAALNQLRETSYSGMIIADWSLTDPAYILATGGLHSNTEVVAVEWKKGFESAYRSKYGQAGSYVLSGYAHASLDMAWRAYSASDKTIDDFSRQLSSLSNIDTVMGLVTIENNGGVSADYIVLPQTNMMGVK